MSSSASKIPTSEWERNKDLIVELYQSKPLKEVRMEMQSQHGFEASSREYEVQLKRWNIRKNATRKEWQQYFAANRDRPITTSPVPGGTGSIFPSVILNKSTASKKRASRWASGNRTSSITSQASRLTLPSNEPRPLARLVPNEAHRPKNYMEAGVPGVALNIASSSTEFLNSTLRIHHSVSSIRPLYDVQTPPNPSQTLFPNANELEQFTGLIPTSLHAYSPTMMPDSISPFLRQNSPGRAVFTSLGIPAENNMVFFSMLKDTISGKVLPSTQFEHSLRSQRVVPGQQSTHTMLGGFATRFVAGILSANKDSITRGTEHLQCFLRKLGSQIPGESSALITDDQAFETKFARLLIFSVLNGFAGLNDVPMENILRFLNRFVINKMLLDIFEQCSKHVSRTLTDNIFRAAIEAKDTTALNLLLSRKLVNVNETICVYNGEKHTPIARAAVLGSPELVKILIDAGADVKGSPEALINNIRNLGPIGFVPSESTTPRETYETLNALFSAGAQVHSRMMTGSPRTSELDFLICQNIDPESHRDFFRDGVGRRRRIATVTDVAREFDDYHAKKTIQKLIDLCHQDNCNDCLVNFGDSLRTAVRDAASGGKVETVQLLLDKFDLKAELSPIFMSAIESGSRAMIDLILSLGPELNPPAVREEGGGEIDFSTPISQALRYRNMGLVRQLEQSGCLDHVHEGDRFEALMQAAAEAGNVAYMRDLLARAVTSKEAYRDSRMALALALDNGHRDIVQMLLEAGATLPTDLRGPAGFGHKCISTLHQRDVEILHALVASGARIENLGALRVKVDCSRIVDMSHEYPELQVEEDALEFLFSHFITENALESFKDFLQHIFLYPYSFESCLETAVEMGRVDMVEYFLDMGANPFTDDLLQYVISNQPDMLQLLFRRQRCRQTVPKCIGARTLESVIGHGIGNTEALDELIRTGAINFTRLEHPDSRRRQNRSHEDYYRCSFTPLGMAIKGVPDAFESNLGAMRKFLNAGADPNGISKSNNDRTQGSALMTGLMVAIETGLEEAVNMLLEYGADINARPRIRTTRTALQYAAELGNSDIVHLLISRGADVNSIASSHGGATALQFAAMSGNCNLVASLLDHGAQLGALPSRIDGMWPLEGAAANGRLDMVRYLWELNVRAVAGGVFPDGFSERHCLRAMNFARENGHFGCRDLISELSGIAVQRLETDEYGAPWIAY